MTQRWEIMVDHQESRRRASLIEGRVRGAASADGVEEVEFSLTLYSDQISLNVPAAPLGRQFIARLTAILGPPRLEPTIKCSCSWGDGVMGAMLIVLWDLAAKTRPQRLQDLHAFLGITWNPS
jgi:hypothetical protein